MEYLLINPAVSSGNNTWVVRLHQPLYTNQQLQAHAHKKTAIYPEELQDLEAYETKQSLEETNRQLELSSKDGSLANSHT